MSEESRLLAMIRNSSDPVRALEVAVEMILKVLYDHTRTEGRRPSRKLCKPPK